MPEHPVPPLFASATVTTTEPEQLSASSETDVIFATGTSAIHWNVKFPGAVPVGAMLSSIV